MGLRISRDLADLESGRVRSGALRRRPRVKLVGNMHGNEPVGRELLLRLARHVLEADRRGSDER